MVTQRQARLQGLGSKQTEFRDLFGCQNCIATEMGTGWRRSDISSQRELRERAEDKGEEERKRGDAEDGLELSSDVEGVSRDEGRLKARDFVNGFENTSSLITTLHLPPPLTALASSLFSSQDHAYLAPFNAHASIDSGLRGSQGCLSPSPPLAYCVPVRHGAENGPRHPHITLARRSLSSLSPVLFNGSRRQCCRLPSPCLEISR